MKEILCNSICEHAAHLGRRDYSSVELTRACLEQIEERDDIVGAFLTVDAERALLAADQSDTRRTRGECRGQLDGIPYGLKDNICVRGMRMTCASRMLEHYIAPYDATVNERLAAAGAVLIGKNNMDEFAMGSSTEYSALGVTRNPHDPTRVAGGSSGGSAAAVAAREVPFSLGTDTGGSVRQPAAFCGVYGLKPTYGVLSRYGVAAMASSLDCVGIITTTAADSAMVLSALAGRDTHDATSVVYPCLDCTTVMQAPIKPMRVAVVSAFAEKGVSADIRKAMQRAIAFLRDYGSVVETVDLPLPEQALATYSVLSCAEASSNLARYDGIRFGSRAEQTENLRALYDKSRADGLGLEVKRRILFGTDMLCEENRERYYVRAQRMRELILRQMTALLKSYDLLLTPTAPTVAFGRGSRPTPDALYYADLCTVYASLSGFPALSIPFGTDHDGMPLAIQLTARAFEESLLLRTAKLLEEAQT